MNKGQSILEVIIAISIFVIIASTGVIAILSSYQTTRLGEEETRASDLAFQGFEAVQSISELNWESLTDGVHGVDNTSGSWQIVSSPTLDPSTKFERTITINPVFRNINGEISDTSGDYDPNSKYITSSVSWDFSGDRPLAVDFQGLVTNWRVSLNTTLVYETDTCLDVCRQSSFTSGICRSSPSSCISGTETYLGAGDIYCTEVLIDDSCCCY